MEVAEHILEEQQGQIACTYAHYGRGKRSVMKRLFDIGFSLLVIVVVYPLVFPLVYLLIKLDSGGSVFFVQERKGLNNKLFRCIKFRTMVENEEADILPARENDHRITRVGRIIRSGGIDELPQFINVLKGDMSVVGPRPHMISDNEQFERVAPHYHKRHLVKPGITGLAQVKGYKGNVRHVKDIRLRTRIDILYVERHNMLLDIGIIAITMKMMITDTLRQAKKKK